MNTGRMAIFANERKRRGRWRDLFVLGCAVGLFGAALPRSAASGEEKPSTARSQMRAIADGITMEVEKGGKFTAVERFADPIYLFGDPYTSRHDGTVWAWGRGGRPAALLSVMPQKAEGKARWLCELTALTASSVVARVPDAPSWTPPEGSSIDFRPVPGAPAPSGDEPKRLRQMKEIARRFKGFEFWTREDVTPRNRYELRLQVQPILRYSDRDAGLLDGALFFLVQGTNPEIALLVEAHAGANAPPAWHYGLTRVAGAELHALLDGHEVWTNPWFFFQKPHDSYWVFTRPLVGFEP